MRVRDKERKRERERYDDDGDDVGIHGTSVEHGMCLLTYDTTSLYSKHV